MADHCKTVTYGQPADRIRASNERTYPPGICEESVVPLLPSLLRGGADDIDSSAALLIDEFNAELETVWRISVLISAAWLFKFAGQFVDSAGQISVELTDVHIERSRTRTPHRRCLFGLF